MKVNMVKTGLLLLLITAVSKIAAFVVTIVFSYFFGAGPLTDAYYAAGTIPNLVINSLISSILTLFVPVYIKVKNEKGEKASGYFASNMLSIFVMVNVLLFVLVSVTSPLLAKLVAPGFDPERLRHTRNMIILLSISYPFTVATIIYNYLYNGNEKYLLPASLTLLNHVLTILLTVIFAPRYGIYVYPPICVFSWIIQLLIVSVNAKGRLLNFKPVVDFKDPDFNYIIKKSVPVMFAMATDQINLAADNIISSDLSSGSISCLGYAHKVFNSINGIISASLLTIYYPILSRQYSQNDDEGFNNSLRRYLEITLILTLSLSSLLIVNSDSIIKILFNRGAMNFEVVSRISLLFVIYLYGLLFMTLKEFFTKLFYIFGETKKPTIVNAVCVAINICLSIILKGLFDVYGIAIATTVSVFLCAVAEGMVLINHVGGFNSIKRHKVFNLKNMIQLLISCGTALVAMLLINRTLIINSVLLKLFINVFTYLVILAVSLLLFQNEYIMLFFKKRQRS